MPADASTRLERVLEDLEHFGVKLGLDRMRRVLVELGSPESHLPVVLVAGTNGKGSVSAWLAAIATAAGYRSGLFTSPHLERVEERMRIDGRAISIERLEGLVERVLAASRRTGHEVVTYFEALTTSALCWFADEDVDVAVMEVGLGGRLDATNVTHPVLSLITSIAFDHQKQLGDTLAEIAVEKAGILRPGRPALASTSEPTVREALLSAAAEKNSHLELLDGHPGVSARRELPAGGQDVTLETRRGVYELASRLSGRHQLDNLALAVAAAEQLALGGYPAIDRRTIEAGVASCRWPGRLEWVALDDGVDPASEVLLDAAHNPAGLTALGEYLRKLGRPFTLVFGMLREKVDPAVVAELWQSAEMVVLTQPTSDRALTPEQLAELVGAEADASIPDPGSACERALESGHLVVACGSLYLIGELRTWLRKRYGVPEVAEQLFEQRA